VQLHEYTPTSFGKGALNLVATAVFKTPLKATSNSPPSRATSRFIALFSPATTLHHAQNLSRLGGCEHVSDRCGSKAAACNSEHRHIPGLHMCQHTQCIFAGDRRLGRCLLKEEVELCGIVREHVAEVEEVLSRIGALLLLPSPGPLLPSAHDGVIRHAHAPVIAEWGSGCVWVLTAVAAGWLELSAETLSSSWAATGAGTHRQGQGE